MRAATARPRLFLSVLTRNRGGQNLILVVTEPHEIPGVGDASRPSSERARLNAQRRLEQLAAPEDQLAPEEGNPTAADADRCKACNRSPIDVYYHTDKECWCR